MTTIKAMSGGDQKVECLRDLLQGELELGEESSQDLKTRARFILRSKTCSSCDISPSQLMGILSKFKSEGFILGHTYTPVYESVHPLKLSDDEGIVVHFPLENKTLEKVVKEFGRITYDSTTRKFIYNSEYVLCKPRFNSKNEQFMVFMYEHPNLNLSTEEIRKSIKSDRLYTSPNQILSDLGFKGSLRKMFFPGASVEGVFFKNPILAAEFEALGVSKELAKDLKKLRRK